VELAREIRRVRPDLHRCDERLQRRAAHEQRAHGRAEVLRKPWCAATSPKPSDRPALDNS